MTQTEAQETEFQSDHTLLPAWAELLAPIDDELPTGSDLRETASADYHALRDARSTARNNERQALAEGETNYIRTADWAPLIDGVPALLKQRSKDVEAVAWLIEALTRTHGFKGVAAGFSLARQLIEHFGEMLHPQPDEDGKATQLAALTGLNGLGSEGALIAPIKSIPLTASAQMEQLSTWQCEQAFELERVADPAKREARSQRGFVTREAVDQAFAETPREHLATVHAELRHAIDAFQRYQEALDTYCQEDPQPTGRIRDTLDGCLQTLNYIAGDRLEAATPSEEAANDDAEDRSDDGSETPADSQRDTVAGGVHNRESALRALRDVASYFRRTEPHSPVSYAIEQAIYWSQLSLPELLGELIPDDGARQKYRTLAGIRTEEH
ncbi:MAG: type VI secretion system protein TssA [Ectothiorhodospiraceae bacterium]|nr:type VI secretion system protein TssA [Ectothiorhodospiraceae bacterium]